MFETATPDWFFSNTIVCNALIFSIVFRLRFARPPGMPRALGSICKLTQKELCYELSHLLSFLLCCCYCCCCCFFAIVSLICQTQVLPDDVILQFLQYHKGSCVSCYCLNTQRSFQQLCSTLSNQSFKFAFANAPLNFINC